MKHPHYYWPKNKSTKSKFSFLSIKPGNIVIDILINVKKISAFLDVVRTYFFIILITKSMSAGSAICIIFLRSSVKIIFLESEANSVILLLNLSEKFANCSRILFLACK